MKSLSYFLLALGACALTQAQELPVLTPAAVPPAMAAINTDTVATPDMVNVNAGWTQQIQKAVAGATNRLQYNLITALNGLANTTAQITPNYTRAFATLTRAVVAETFDLVQVVAYMPKLLLLDMPNQFIEVLKLIRRNEVRVVPSDVNGAIDNILALTRQAQESGIMKTIFDPVIKYLPNMMTGIHDFLQTIVGTTANVFGTGVYRYDPEVNNGIVRAY